MTNLSKKKGFTIIETLIAMLIMGVIMVGVTHAMSELATTTEKVDEATFAISDGLYVLELLQKDSFQAIGITEDKDSFTFYSYTDSVATYEVKGGTLYRNSHPIGDIIKAAYSVAEDSLEVNILFVSNTSINTTLYLKGDCLYETLSEQEG